MIVPLTVSCLKQCFLFFFFFFFFFFFLVGCFLINKLRMHIFFALSKKNVLTFTWRGYQMQAMGNSKNSNKKRIQAV